jgi:hypothetical protein
VNLVYYEIVINVERLLNIVNITKTSRIVIIVLRESIYIMCVTVDTVSEEMY